MPDDSKRPKEKGGENTLRKKHLLILSACYEKISALRALKKSRVKIVLPQ